MTHFFFKQFLIGVLGVLLSLVSTAQSGPVKWNFTAKKTADKTYEIHLTAMVDEPWHIYAQNTPKGGPLPTTIKLSKNPLVIPQGKVKEVGELEMYHDNVFDVDVYAYGQKVDFVQLVKLKTKIKTKISGTVQFMACTKEQCLTPETIPFSLALD